MSSFEEPFHFAEGKVGFKFKDSVIVTSPNADFIPDFPEIGEDGIYLRGDGSFGPQEYSRWPQMYTESLCHHATIPVEPEDMTCPLWESLILFRSFTRQDWFPLAELPILTKNNASEIEYASGLLDSKLCSELEEALERAITICKSLDVKDKSRVLALEEALASKARAAISRLKTTPDSAHQVVFSAKDVQRAALELHGIYNYFSVVKARMEAYTDAIYPAGPYLGSFSDKAAEVQLLHRVGIPVWYIRSRAIDFDTVKVNWVPAPKPFQPTVDINGWKCVNNTYLVTRKYKDGGHLRDSTRLYYDHALREMMEKVMNFSMYRLNSAAGETGQAKKNVDKPSAAVKRKALESGQRKRSKKTKSADDASSPPVGRTAISPAFQFDPTCCPDAPLLPHACKEALIASSPLPTPSEAVVYFFPPPWLLDATREETKSQLYHNYLRVRTYCHRRYLNETIEDVPRRIAFWREVVKGNYRQMVRLPKDADSSLTITNSLLPVNEAGKESSSSSSKSAPNKRLLSQSLARTEFGARGELPPYDPDCTVLYGERIISVSNCKDKSLREELQFELFELNWRAEILALDAAVLKSESPDQTAFAFTSYSKRRGLIFKIWSIDGTATLLLPSREHDILGAWAENSLIPSSQKHQAVVNLLAVLSEWPNFPHDLRAHLEDSIHSYNPLQLRNLIKRLFHFYTKTFCKFFNRLPVLPCCFPTQSVA